MSTVETKGTTKFCPKCKWSSIGNYCYKDGTKLVEFMRCECGKECGPQDNFCENCGKKMQELGK